MIINEIVLKLIYILKIQKCNYILIDVPDVGHQS